MYFASSKPAPQALYVVLPEQPHLPRRRLFFQRLLGALSVGSVVAIALLIIALIIVLAVLFSRNFDFPIGIETNIIGTPTMHPLFVYLVGKLANCLRRK